MADINTQNVAGWLLLSFFLTPLAIAVIYISIAIGRAISDADRLNLEGGERELYIRTIRNNAWTEIIRFLSGWRH